MAITNMRSLLCHAHAHLRHRIPDNVSISCVLTCTRKYAALNYPRCLADTATDPRLHGTQTNKQRFKRPVQPLDGNDALAAKYLPTNADSLENAPLGEGPVSLSSTSALKQLVMATIDQFFLQPNNINAEFDSVFWENVLRDIQTKAVRIANARKSAIYAGLVFGLRERNMFSAIKSFVTYAFKQQNTLRLNTNLPFLVAVLDVMRDERCRHLVTSISGNDRFEDTASAEHVFSEQDILSITKRLQQFIGVLDSNTEDVLIGALATTEARWKTGLTMLLSKLKALQGTRTTTTKTMPRLPVITVCVASAFLNNDEKSALQILSDFCALCLKGLAGIRLPDELQHIWYTYYKNQRGMSCSDAAKTVFQHMQQFECFPTVGFLQRVQRDLNQATTLLGTQATPLPAAYDAKLAEVSLKGECSGCGRYVARLELPPPEFDLLRDTFMGRVISGRDLHVYSYSNELESFREFVKNNGPFDVVIDGLNLAFLRNNETMSASVHIGNPDKRSPATRAWLIRTVVEHVVKRRPKRVCVIGRRHMRGWSREHMNAIMRMASMFFVSNDSKDDMFLLYAALYSGPDCVILSSDTYSDFAFAATEHDPKLRRLFLKWQRMVQMRVTHIDPHGVVKLIAPVAYDTSIQIDDARWHVPYFSGTTSATLKYPEDWFCVRKI